MLILIGFNCRCSKTYSPIKYGMGDWTRFSTPFQHVIYFNLNHLFICESEYGRNEGINSGAESHGCVWGTLVR